MLNISTSVSTEEFNTCFVETPFTRRIAIIEWPEGLGRLTISRKDMKITKEEV